MAERGPGHGAPDSQTRVRKDRRSHHSLMLIQKIHSWPHGSVHGGAGWEHLPSEQPGLVGRTSALGAPGYLV